MTKSEPEERELRRFIFRISIWIFSLSTFLEPIAYWTNLEHCEFRWRARCCRRRRRRRRGFLKVTRWRASQVKRWFRLPVPSFVLCLQPMLFLCERARATAKRDGKYDYPHHPSWLIFCFRFRWLQEKIVRFWKDPQRLFYTLNLFKKMSQKGGFAPSFKTKGECFGSSSLVSWSRLLWR